MLPRHFFRLSRGFSDSKKAAKSAVFKFNVAFIVTSVILLNGYAFYSTSQVDRKARSRRYAHMDKLLKSNPHFDVLERPEVKQQLLNLLKENQVVVLFGPSFTGKTELIKDIQNQQKVVYLQGTEIFEDFMNSWGYEDKFEHIQFNEFMGVIEYAVDQDKETILVIDQFEKISDMYTMRIAESIMYWADKKKMKVIIVTSSEGSANMFQKVVNAKIFVAPRFQEHEFVKVMTEEKKYSEGVMKDIWDQVGDDLGYAKEILNSELIVEKYLEKKKDEILMKAEEDDSIKGLIENALSNVGEEHPLGNVFKGSKLGSFLLSAQIGRSYVGSVEFRNKFVLKVFQENLIKNRN